MKIVLCLLPILCCASCLSVISVNDNKKPPEYSDVYWATGILKLPYAEIEEPFEIWFDGPNNRSRIDYYNGTMKTYQRADLTPKTSQKVAYFTNETAFNLLTCFETTDTSNGTDPTVTPQSVFPDLESFETYLGNNHVYNNVRCDVWEHVVTEGQKVNTYRFWATYSEKNDSKPVLFEMFGRNILFGGSHYDKYQLIYSSFEEDQNFTDSVFEVENGLLPCHGFPGPGVNDHLLLNPMHEFVDGHHGYIDSMFSDFKDKHNKTYSTDEEHYQRQKNFLHNIRYIHSHNRAGKSYSVAMNHLGDWSDVEIKILRGRIPTDFEQYDGEVFDITQYDPTVPDMMDWRLFGAVTPVKDQAVCGSCWSFGTTGAVEGGYFVKTQNLVVLSQQALIDCSWGFGNNGCDGGEDYRAYEWIKIHGLPKAEAYGPYLGVDGKCKNISDAADKVFIQSYTNVTSRDDQALKVAMFHNGPHSVSIDASRKAFSFYSNGVYEDPTCKSGEKDLDHSVLAVGYGVILNKPYWLIKNSWSTYWGNDGYILISQDHDCGVTTQATYVTV